MRKMCYNTLYALWTIRVPNGRAGILSVTESDDGKHPVIDLYADTYAS